MKFKITELSHIIVERAMSVHSTHITFESRMKAVEQLQEALDNYKERIISEEIEKRKEKVYRATEAVEEMRKYTKK